MRLQVFDVGNEYADFLHDESRREGYAEKIAFPTSPGEVRECLIVASSKGWPVTVQGGRTGITGGCVPEGGLILNLGRMNAIGAIQGDLVTVQPGARLENIRSAILESGLFFPSDLTETTATIGGMVSNNASGARSYKYGAVRQWIHALEVILSTGEIIRLERGVHRADGRFFKTGSVSGVLPEWEMPKVKSAAGYFMQRDMDLVDLFIGAEGTLGVVTEITLKLLPVSDFINGLTAFFSGEEAALAFVRFLRDESNPQPTAIEFFDARALALLRRMKTENTAFSDLPDLNAEYHTAIYFEFEAEVPENVINTVDEWSIDCWFAEGIHEIEFLKKFRHAIPESVNLLIGERRKTIPGLTKLGTDMSVPDSYMERVMQMYHEGLKEAGLEYVIFGHIGNNHVHVNILPRCLEEFERGKALYLDWAAKVVEMGGSISAEHGIGKIKTGFLKLMVGEPGLDEMRRIRQLFDPVHLLNPGNLWSNDLSH